MVVHLERVDMSLEKRHGLATHDIYRAREGVNVLFHAADMLLKRIWRFIKPC
jgi:hypothetical protein